MSRSFSDALELWIAPDRVEIARYTGWWSPKRVAAQSYEVSAPPGSNANVALLGVVDRAVAASGATRASMRITLSNSLVRYAIVGWQPGVVRNDDLRGMAVATFRAIYGERAGEWEIALGDQRVGKNYLAGAIDRELLAGLQLVAKKIDGRIARITPFYSRAFDAYAKSNSSRAGRWFATCEPGQLCVGFERGGAWELIRTRSVKRAVGDELLVMLEQARIGAGIDRPSGTVRVVARDLPPITFPSGTPWRFELASRGTPRGNGPSSKPSMTGDDSLGRGFLPKSKRSVSSSRSPQLVRPPQPARPQQPARSKGR